jgi:hypothetical protein
MPEYHLDVHDEYAAWRRLDSFTQGYIEAMFFTEHSPAFDYADIEEDRAAWEEAEREGQSDGTIPGDATFADLAPEALQRCIDDCAAFYEANRELIQAAIEHGGARGDYDETRAGHDYWYTRNGHGVGFWDRGLGDIGEKLSAACRYSEVNPYLGDDNKVHLS